MGVTLEKAQASGLEAYRRVKKEVSAVRPLWPDRFSDNTAECAWRFVLEQRTWNEAEQEVQFFPDKPFLEQYVYEWHHAFKMGRPLIIEKCRRLVISWCARALELHQLGLGRCDQILCGEDLEAAAKHVWRLKFLYTDLQSRHDARSGDDWNLPPHSELKYEGDRKLKMFGLPNGSVCNYANGQSSGLQGDGTAIITLEELGIYPYAGNMLAQAKIITEASAKATGGFVNAITNASVMQAWQDIKRFNRDDEGVVSSDKVWPLPPGFKDVSGLERTDLPGQERYLKLHYFADPEKDSKWLAAMKLKMRSTPHQYRLQYLMEDKQAEHALWNREMFDEPGFRLPAVGLKDQLIQLPSWIVRTVVAVDPSVSDPLLKKNPNKKPDECGIMVVGLTDDSRGVVLADFSGVYSPNKWARIVVKAYQLFRCGSIVYEANQGGELVRDTLKTISPNANIIAVHAAVGKRARAEPVAALYEAGRFSHCGDFNDLENEMVTWNAQASTLSPARIDSLVWGAHGVGLCDATGTRTTQSIGERT